jgi:hypothetical protein
MTAEWPETWVRSRWLSIKETKQLPRYQVGGLVGSRFIIRETGGSGLTEWGDPLEDLRLDVYL